MNAIVSRWSRWLLVLARWRLVVIRIRPDRQSTDRLCRPYATVHHVLRRAARRGFSFELLANLSKQMGVRLSVRQLPWARCLQQVRLGKIDLAIDAYEDVERRKVFHYSNPYYTLTPQVFYRANDPAVSQELMSNRAAVDGA